MSRDTAELQQARAYWSKRQYRKSLDLFDRAVRKDPANSLALTDAARAFGARFEFARSEELLDRLVDLGGRRADILQMAGQSYRMIQRPERAVECLEQALSLTAGLFEARLELALLYERRHLLDTAADHVQAALSDRPGSQEAQFLAGRIERRRDNANVAEAILQDVARKENTHWITRSQAWHELGQLYDEAGQYDEAYESVCKGKRATLPHAGAVQAQSEAESGRIEPLHGEIRAEDFESWRQLADDSGFEPRPMALLTGAPRSGTTLLEKVLDSHPRIVTSDEQPAFGQFILPALLLGLDPDAPIHPPDLSAIPAERMRDERSRYFRYMEDSMGEEMSGRLHIDKNPSTIMLIPCMLRLFPECKLVVALRDPRDVVVSCFMRYLPLNTVSVRFLTIGGAAERYRRDMGAWLELRKIIGSPWNEVRYEDTVEDLRSEVQKVVEFLGLEWSDSVMSYRGHMQRRQVNSPTYEAVAKPVYRSAIGRWRNYEKHLGDAMETVLPLCRELGYDL